MTDHLDTDGAAANRPAPHPAAAPLWEARSPAAVRTILLVDDSEDHRALAIRAFERVRDMRVRTAATLSEARSAMRDPVPDLVLADLRLPDGLGTDLLARRAPETARVPIIILTAHGDEEAAVTALKAGALDYVVKSPHSLSSLPEISRRGLREWDLLREKEQAQARLRELNEHLEQRVQERTAALQHALQDLDAFNHTVSHDLRAPIRHVLGFCELLREHAGGSFDETATRYVATIEAAARRLDQMLRDLLELSRTDVHALHVESVPLARVVEAARQDLRVDWNGREVQWVLPADLPTVRADESLLRMVFVNLLSNALKFSRGREPARIEIAARSEPTEHIVAVHDNGVGFDMRHARQLFGVFQRLHPPEAYEGSGMGLANTRRVIARHGGRIWAEAAPQVGASFFFSLPV